MLLAVCHSTKGWTRVQDLDRLSDLRSEAGNLLWAEADVVDLTPEDVEVIAEEFDLHPLAVEDARAPKQRPKLEVYPNHLFMTIHQLDVEEGQLEPRQLAFFIGPSYILTIHHDARRTIDAAKDRWDDPATMSTSGPAGLLHSIIDVIVDDYQGHADEIEAEIEDLEEMALALEVVPIQRPLYSVKQRISRLRRFALPVERVVDGLIERNKVDALLPDESTDLFNDAKDHVIRIGAQLKSADELTQAVLDLVRGEQAEALGVQGRKLSAWAAIFAVGTLIAGIYGMNFKLIPEENSLLGFWFAVVGMVGASVALYAYFKKRGWL